MNSRPLPKDRSISKIVTQLPAIDSLCRSVLLTKLKNLKYGLLEIIDRSQNPHTFYSFGDKSSTLKACIIVNHHNFYSRSLLGGSIGNAESYIDKDWDCQELTNLVRIFVLNRETLQNIDNGIVNLLGPIQKFFHGLNRNTVEGSLKNIRSHYDIGNDFFKLFLDETMMYSCALFENEQNSLLEASQNKIKTIVEKLKLKPTDHLIEIGTGWGSLAIYAAKTYGCKVTTTTISRQQYDYAQEQIIKAGLEDKITLLFQDYRHLTGKFDALVSVEMIEAVGLDHLGTYFEKCSSLIKDDGVMVLQAITIRDQYYESARKSVDFIQRHVFPGSGIPSVHAMMNAITKKTDLCLVHQEDFAENYAKTLNHWALRLEENKDQITELGYPEFLYRLWQYYFSYCEGGFKERAIGLSQMVLAKPFNRDY